MIKFQEQNSLHVCHYCILFRNVAIWIYNICSGNTCTNKDVFVKKNLFGIFQKISVIPHSHPAYHAEELAVLLSDDHIPKMGTVMLPNFQQLMKIMFSWGLPSYGFLIKI